MRRSKTLRVITAIAVGLMLLAGVFSGCSPAKSPRTADIAILYTSDVHCGVSDNIGYAGLEYYRKSLVAGGAEVLLVDSGDAIQGGAMGSFTEGEGIIELMNMLGYSAMTVGNHEFDYSVERLAELSKIADFPFLSVNFCDLETGEAVFEPYTVVESDGVKIAFIGVSTPETITSSTPIYFMDENGDFVYGFSGSDGGKELWNSVQTAVDSARNEGADYVIALTHLGISASSEPFTSNTLIANTSGIDAVLDGHSHSIVEGEQVKNKVGEQVLLSATGTKLENIGVLTLDVNGKISSKLVSDAGGTDSAVTEKIAGIESEYSEKMNTVAAHIDTELTVNDPSTGVRIVRVAETNLGDFCADAYRAAGDSDIAFANGGGIRAPIAAGDVTYGDLLAVNPFGNLLCKVRVTGQVILDALEFGVRDVPTENGAFLQVSGLTYEIRTDIESSVKADENEMFISVEGERRVQNVLVGGVPIDSAAEYTLVSHNYMLKNFGDGYTMFGDCEILLDEFMLDASALIDYMNNGYAENAARYSDPYGEGRIIAVPD